MATTYIDLADELQLHGLPRTWKTIVGRLRAQRDCRAGSTQTCFGGSKKTVMEAVFRKWEDHFTVVQDGRVTHRFDVDHAGHVTVHQRP